MPEATSHAETYHRHGDPDPDKWEEAEAVTGRPNDNAPGSVVQNSTLASRAAAAAKATAKEVKADSTEDKAVTSASTKTPAKRAAKKSN